jgi:hypothetical protein
MKPLRKHLKLIALFLTVTFLVQSCTVYRYKVATTKDAVSSGDRVKFDIDLSDLIEVFKAVRKYSF